jgi:hypothetical protein
VDVPQAAVCNLESGEWGSSVFAYLAALAWQGSSGPQLDVGVHARPHEFVFDCSTCGFEANVCGVVEKVENFFSEFFRYVWADVVGGGVVVEWSVCAGWCELFEVESCRL